MIKDGSDFIAGKDLNTGEKFNRWILFGCIVGPEATDTLLRNGNRVLKRTIKSVDDIPWITPKSLPINEEQAVLNTMKHIENGTVPSGKLSKKWGTPFGNREGYLPAGNYLEYRVAPPVGNKGAGARRVVKNVDTGDLFYTWTHYGDSGDPAFLRIK
jgi:guanyl-specific ribonuclease Sa